MGTWLSNITKRGLFLRWHNVRRCSVEKKNKTLFFKQVKNFLQHWGRRTFYDFFLHLLNFEIKKPYKEKSERPWHCIITRPIKTFFPFQIVMVKNIITLLAMFLFLKKKMCGLVAEKANQYLFAYQIVIEHLWPFIEWHLLAIFHQSLFWYFQKT